MGIISKEGNRINKNASEENRLDEILNVSHSH